MTGAELVHELWIAAKARGVGLHTFVEPLTSQPGKWTRQLREASCPKPATIERVRALIDGRELPPAANQRQIGTNRTLSSHQSHAERRAEDLRTVRDQIEQRRYLGELAHAERRPGETIHAAVRRLEEAAA
jgi:hypothetical protein